MNDFIKELTILRTKISNPNKIKSAFEELKELKTSLISYLNMLNFLKSKITFGSDQFSLKIDFTWNDVIKDSNITSNNINYEIYCNLFNLAICNNHIAKNLDPNFEDEIKMKEAIKLLEYSAGIMERIKNEVPKNLNSKEIPLDFSDAFTQFVSFLFIF